MSEPIVIKTVEELKEALDVYREAVAKLVISHAINELYGAQVFDEPEAALDLRVPAQDLGGIRRHQAVGRPGRDPAGRGTPALHLPSAQEPRAPPCRRNASTRSSARTSPPS
jgi:hypothetical protein